MEIKKYNKTTEQWEVLASNIKSNDIENRLEVLENNTDILEKNVAWLALHGGGGSGSGGGFSDNNIDVTISNAVNGDISVQNNSAIVTFYFTGTNRRATYNAYLYLDNSRIDSKLNVLAGTEYSFSIKDIRGVDATKVSHNIRVTVEDDFDYLGNKECTVTRIETYIYSNDDTITASRINLSNDTIPINYYSSVEGTFDIVCTNSPILAVEDGNYTNARGEAARLVINGSNKGKSYGLNIAYKDLNITRENVEDKEDDYLYFHLVKYGSTTALMYIRVHVVYVTSTSISITSTGYSTDISNISIVKMGSYLQLAFVTYYSSNITAYYLTVDAYKLGEENNKINILSPDESNPTAYIYNRSYTETVSLKNETLAEFFEPNSTYVVRMTAKDSNGIMTSSVLTYIYIEEAENSSLLLFAESNGDGTYNHNPYTLFDFKASSFVSYKSSLEYLNNSFIRAGQDGYKYKFILNSYNKLNNDIPNYIKYFNKAYGIITSDSSIFPSSGTDIYSAINNYNPSFTLSVSFITDDYSTDEHIVCQLGDIQKSNNGYSGNGILITNEKVIVQFSDTSTTVSLESNITSKYFTNICIVYNEESDIFATNDKGDEELAHLHFLKIYENGIIVKAVRSYAGFLSLDRYEGAIDFSPNSMIFPLKDVKDIYIGCGIKNKELYNYTNTKLYNIAMYSTAFDVNRAVLDYINNYVLYQSDENGIIDSDLLNSMLDKNSMVKDATTGIYSSLLTDSSIGTFSVRGLFDENNTLVKNVQDALPIPFIVLDFGNNDAWTLSSIKGATDTSDLNTASDVQISYYVNGNNIFSNTNTTVRVSIQGTTSTQYTSKNFNIDFQDKLFWAKSDWFPEQVYTLKADVSDSAHTNNACIGKFINDCYTKGGIVDSTPPMKEYNPNNLFPNFVTKPTIKQTLEGFPTFLILRIKEKKTSSTPSFVALGIYSFNLGRQSYYNIGYRLLKKFTDIEGNEVTSGVAPMLLKNDSNSQNEITYGAEAWEGAAQKDCTLVKSTDEDYNQLSTLEKNLGMKLDSYFWGYDNVEDFFNSVYSEVSSSTFNNEILKFIATLPYQPDNKSIIANNVNFNVVFGTEYNLYSKNKVRTDPATGLPITVKVTERDDGTEIPFNYKNAIFYYTICMLFGLKDNLSKNMVMRKWSKCNDTLWYTCFYDMDTALGLDNTGKENVPSDIYDIIISNNNETPQRLKFLYPNADSDTTLFDSFSCKLWGVIDTASFKQQFLDNNGLFGFNWKGGNNSGSAYSIMWAKLRNTILQNVDSFVDDYFIGQTQDVGEIYFNYDYDIKYLNTSQLNFLHGNRRSFVRKWLKERVDFLDTLFHYLAVNTNYQNTFELNNSSIYSVINQKVNIGRGAGDRTINLKTTSPLIVHTVDQGQTANTNNVFINYRYMPKDTLVALDFNTQNNAGSNTMINCCDHIKYIDNLTTLKVNSITAIVGNEINSSLKSLEKLNFNNIKTLDGNWNFRSIFTPFIDNTYDKEDEYFSNLTEIDFSNTDTYAGASKIAMDLSDTANSKTGKLFSNITDINISNSSAISSLKISESCYLQNLDISNSSLNQFGLYNQPFLSTFNTFGCPNLATLTISNCIELTSLTFDNPKLSSLTIQACPKIKTITINLLNSTVNKLEISLASGLSALETFSITNAKDSVEIVLNLNGADRLKTLNLNKCNCSVPTLHANCRNTLKTLNLSESKVKGIFWSNLPESESNLYPQSSENVEILDLRNMVNLTNATLDFSISNNKAVEYVRFDNISGSRINLKSSFMNCSNLLRVYGNVSLSSIHQFHNCSKFSIHGRDITTVTYRNVPVYNSSTRRVLHPSEDTNMYNTNGIVWQSGDNVTNLYLALNTYNDTTNYVGLFSNTSCTLFDMYYVLCKGVINNLTDARFLFRDSGVRTGCTIDISNFTYYDNSLSRKTFVDAGNITDITNIIDSSNISGWLILYSPTHDENGNITADDGLFSPLTKLKKISLVGWASRFMIFDRFLFRRKSGNYVINTLEDLSPLYLVNDSEPSKLFVVSNINILNIAKSEWEIKPSVLGNCTDFFNNLPSLASIYNVFRTKHLQFNTITNCPATTVNVFCISDTSTGNFRIENLFGSNETSRLIRNIYNSFISNGSVNGSAKTVLTIDSDTFKYMPYLSNIYHSTDSRVGLLTTKFQQGHCFTGNGITKIIDIENADTLEGILPTHITNISNLESLFMNGLFKSTSSNSTLKLPGNLFIRQTKLSSIDHLFYNLKPHPENSHCKQIELTSDGFKNCPNLSNINYLFAQSGKVNNSILTGNIPKRLFYHGETLASRTITGIKDIYIEVTLNKSDYNDINISGNNITTIHTSQNTIVSTTYYSEEILSDNNNTIVFKCFPTSQISVITTMTNDSEDPTITYNTTNYGNYSNLQPETITYQYRNVNRSITSMKYVFAGQTFSESYENSNFDTVYDIENNPDYNPFTFVKNNNVWYLNPSKNTNSKTFMWSYDGKNVPNDFKENINTYEYLDDVKHYLTTEDFTDINNDNYSVINFGNIMFGGTTIEGEYSFNFAFAPDLLRYCNSSITSVQGLFYKCGVRENGNYNVIDEFPTGDTGKIAKHFGLKGRLIPYMFKNTPNLEDISFIFTDCKSLSYTAENINYNSTTGEYDGYTYTIPKTFFDYTTKIINLESAFEGMVFPDNVNLNVFSSLTNENMNLRRIFFHPYFMGRANLVNTFSFAKSYTNISFCFTGTVPYNKKSLVESFPIKAQLKWDTDVIQFESFQASTKVTFTNIFNSDISKSSNTDYAVFAGYGSGTSIEINKKTVTETGHYNYNWSN